MLGKEQGPLWTFEVPSYSVLYFKMSSICILIGSLQLNKALIWKDKFLFFFYFHI